MIKLKLFFQLLLNLMTGSLSTTKRSTVDRRVKKMINTFDVDGQGKESRCAKKRSAQYPVRATRVSPAAIREPVPFPPGWLGHWSRWRGVCATVAATAETFLWPTLPYSRTLPTTFVRVFPKIGVNWKKIEKNLYVKCRKCLWQG